MVGKKYVGVEEISIRMSGKSYNTLMTYKKQRNFPMYKPMGQWQAYEEDITRWEEFQDNGVFFEDSDLPSRKKNPVSKKKGKNSSKKLAQK